MGAECLGEHLYVKQGVEMQFNTFAALGRDKPFSVHKCNKRGYNAVIQFSLLGHQEQATRAAAQNQVSEELSVITVGLNSLLTDLYC